MTPRSNAARPRPDRADRPARALLADRTVRADGAAGPDRADRTGRPARALLADRPDRVHLADRTVRGDPPVGPRRPRRPGHPDKPCRPGALVMAAIAVLALIAGAGGCVGDRPALVIPSSGPAGTGAGPSATTPPSTCTTPPEASTASFEPGGVTAAAAAAQTIKKNVLVAGVSADTFLMGYRNPRTAQLEGFDIDVARALAAALFGDPERVEFKVINNAQRIPALREGEVDVVVRSMTITCGRWEQIDFSTEYLRAGRRLLVRSDDAARGITGLSQLAGRRVCGTTGSTGLEALRREHPEVEAVAEADNTDCMVAFQQGTVDAIVSDDTILAGFARQDPYAQVVGPALSGEPYGVGVRKGNTDLTRFINGVLERLRAGEWAQIYNRWLGSELPPASPPPPVYGRVP